MGINRKNLALVQDGVDAGTEGGGAAGRFFLLFFKKYHQWEKRRFNLYFITDGLSYDSIIQDRELHALKAYLIRRKNVLNRLKNLVEKVQYSIIILRYDIRLLHICHYYHSTYFHLLKFLKWFPKSVRVAINFIHCNFPYYYNAESGGRGFHTRFDPLFNEAEFHGIFSWYELFKTFSEENKLIKCNPYIYPIKHYFCDTSKFFPDKDKENLIVFAARFDNQKDPLAFVDAIHWVNKRAPEKLIGWKVLICGKGYQEQEVRDNIVKYGLGIFTEVRTNISDMAPILNKSKCFVSTQHYENFTSLSMNEALASGNAIVSKNVGQTNYYVRDGENGFLSENESSESVGAAILRYLENPQLHERMQKESVRITREVHTFDNFCEELENFWEKLLLTAK